MGVLSWSLSIPLIAALEDLYRDLLSPSLFASLIVRLIPPYNYRRAALPERVGDRESRDSEIAPTDKPKKTIVKRLGDFYGSSIVVIIHSLDRSLEDLYRGRYSLP